MNKELIKKIGIYSTIACVTVIGITLFCYFFCKKNNTWEVTISYDQSIKTLPINTLKNLRDLSPEEKTELYNKLDFQSIFSPEKACDAIALLKNPQVVLWFTDHIGDIKKLGLTWYQNNIVKPLKNKNNICYWLADLTAWRYLSLKDQELMAFDDYKSFKQLNTDEQLTSDKCPLLNDFSKTLSDELSSSLRNIKIIRANNFFRWLLELPGSVFKLSGNLASNLCRSDQRQGTDRFSLQRLGFNSPFLDGTLAKLNTNLSDADHTQIFPLLQYLEAVYYVFRVVDSYQPTTDNATCNIIFLLPNKEFTYYLVNGEATHFETFGKNVQEILTNSMPRKNGFCVNIHFLPFAYGSDFYAGPFDEQGPPIQSPQELRSMLLND